MLKNRIIFRENDLKNSEHNQHLGPSSSKANQNNYSHCNADKSINDRRSPIIKPVQKIHIFVAQLLHRFDFEVVFKLYECCLLRVKININKN